eukprot:scaffold13633_cov64-Phaeocystis_antarctica.AAC.6
MYAPAPTHASSPSWMRSSSGQCKRERTQLLGNAATSGCVGWGMRCAHPSARRFYPQTPACPHACRRGSRRPLATAIR